MKAITFRPMWIRLVCMVFSCLLIISCFQNLDARASGITISIPNSSFEDAGTGIPHWTTHPTYGQNTATVSNERAYTGLNSMKMVDTSSTASLARVSEKVSITQNEEYTASTFAYIEQGSIDVWLIFYNGTTETVIAPTGSVTPTLDQWTKRTITAKAPAGTTQVAVMVYSTLASVTTAYIDDVSIGQTVKNAGFEDTLSGWTVSSGAAVSTVQKAGGTFSLKLDDSSPTTASTAESSKVTVYNGTRVGATAKIYASSGSGLSIHLLFKNDAGIVLKDAANDFTGIASQWTPVSVSATAPSGTTSVSVYLTTGITTSMVAYVDDVTLDRPIEYNLGVQIKNNPLDVAVFGKDASGNTDLMYVGSSGFPSKLVVYDARTGELLDDRDLMVDPNNTKIEAVWGMTVATDKSVYLGTANKKTMFRYLPGTVSTVNGQKVITGSSLVPITLPTGMEVIWDVTAGSNGKVYGGTSTDGKAFQYDPTGGTVVLNSGLPIVSGLDFVRSIAYASDTEVYMGMGPTSNATIIRFNPTNGTQTTISPSNYGSKFVHGLDYISNGASSRVFAQLTAGPTLVLDSTTGAIASSLSDIDSRGVSMKHPSDDKVFYTKGNNLYSYDISTAAELNLGDVGGSAAGYTFLTDAGNTYLYAALKSGKILKYKLAATPTIDTTTSFVIPESVTKIRSLVKGPADNIYTSGYLLGGMGIYNPDTSEEKHYKGAGQAENMTTLGNNLYLGIYPGAWIKKYDTTSTWNDTTNPSLLFQDIDDAPYKQDRPFGMLAEPSMNRLYVGSVASSGNNKGSFTVYDLSTSQQVTTINDIVYHQSVISLAYKNNKVFGGTSVYGGISSAVDATEGKVFVWNTTGANSTPVPQFVPAPGRKVISDLIVGPDGKIWGLAEGNSSGNSSHDTTADLFIIDPNNPDAAHTTVYPDKFSSIPVSWQGGKMVVGNDGNVYVSIGAKLYAFDANSANKDAVSLIGAGVTLLTTDRYGDLYYVKHEINLYKYDK